MLLSDENIKQEIHSRHIIIDPYDDQLIQPASIDIRLGNQFTYTATVHQESSFIDPAEDNSKKFMNKYVPDGTHILIHPNQFMLGHTIETITLPNHIAARLEGRSSYGRLGLVVHSTAGFIDPGFTGQVTLELANLTPYPIKLRPGTRIAQLCFFALVSPSANPYGTRAGSKYQGQKGATSSLSHRDE